jgi:ABC-2 type transport system ATP-binding protein
MNMNEQPIILLRDLTRRFGDVMAVDHLTLEVYSGEVFGFLGHNGAGKTTTVRLLNGVLASSAGTARVLGMSPIEEGPQLRQHTGVLTETPSLDERLTGHENLTIYADLYGVPPGDVAERVHTLLEMFELDERADEKVGGYSKGMKQRLALARALVHRPTLLFLDEPTSGLDPVATRRVHELITRLSQEEGSTVFMCTHNMAEAQKLCDRVAVLEHGRLVALGTPAELARQVGRSQRLEIEVDPQGMARAVEILKDAPGTSGLSQDGDVITLQGADREAVPDLVAGLAEAGVRVYRVSPQEPALEDIYFALHEI